MVEKCLVIGLGQIGMEYDLNHDPAVAVYSHARAISLHPDFELAGAVDSSFLQRSIFEKNYTRPSFDDISVAMRQSQASVVIIASPSETHAAVLDQVLSQAQLKIILCEKPLAYDLAEARKMVDACDRAGIKLYVNYMRRADSGVLEVKRRIEKNEISAPIKGVVWYSKGFLNNGSHFFNLLEFWLGRYIGFKLIDAGRLWDGVDPEPDVAVEFERGTVTFLPAWEEAFSHYTLELLSQSGRLRYEQGGESIAWQSVLSDPDFSGYRILNPVPEKIGNGMKRYQWYVFEQLAASLVGKHNTLCTGRQALATLEFMHEIIKERKL
jgi:predicted dehydrogenase